MNIQRTLALISLLILTACGGGGSTQAPANATITTMKLTLALQGSAAAAVKGFQATITLPAGVSVRADATGKVLADVMTATGSAAAASLGGNYMPATATSPGSVTIALMSSANLSAGDIIVFDVDLAPGVTAPISAVFAVPVSKLVGTGGADVNEASLLLR